MRVRFGAAPTGHLDVARARWAVLAWRLAQDGHGANAAHGAFVLAIEADGKPAFAAALEHDLRWLGVVPDRVVDHLAHPSDRGAQAAQALRRAGRLYPCFETEAELAAKRDRRRRRGQPAAYDRAMLRLTPAQRAAAEAGGKRPYWRFRLSDGAVGWRDALLGPQSVALGALSDPVLVRADGTAQRLLATVVDELDLGTTHALRDAAHRAGTAIELDVRAALAPAAPPLVFAHHPALAPAAPLPTLRRLRADGVEPTALLGYLATGGPRFDIAALRRENRRVLAQTPFETVAGRLPAGASPAFWHAVRDGIDLLGEAAARWEVVGADFAPPPGDGDPAWLRAALAALPPLPWSPDTWRAWLAATGAADAGRAAQLRRALTGEDDGPALDGLLPLIGRARAAARLQAALDQGPSPRPART